MYRAYAYLLLSPDRKITTDAQRRLKAIEEFTSLGAGFKIALRNLEIHGAGNILGMEQSGHIAAVGYEMYCQLLENAVRYLKQMPAKAAIDVSVDVPWPAYLPRDYVPGQKQRLEVYRRLSRVRDPQKLDDFRQDSAIAMAVCPSRRNGFCDSWRFGCLRPSGRSPVCTVTGRTWC